MLREEIRESAERVVEMLKSYPDIADNESQTKTSLIEPVLRSLGYDTTHPGQVTLEVSTELGGKIDYMLTGESKATIAVEAKRAGMNLSDKETKQLRAYFTFSEAVAGILTNGVTYWLFTDLDKSNVMDLKPYRKIDIRQVTGKDLHQLECLSRNMVSKDGIHEEARQNIGQTQINRIVAQELAEPSPEFLKLVGKKAGTKPLNQKNLAFLYPLVKEAISRNLSREVRPPLDLDLDPKSEPTGADSSDGRAKPKGPGQKAALTKQQFQGATLFGQNLHVKNYREMLISVVKELQSRHSGNFHLRVREAPFFKASRKRQYISTDEHQFHPRHSKTQVNNYWVDTHHSAKGAIKRARLFIREFGHDPEELTILTQDDSNPD